MCLRICQAGVNLICSLWLALAGFTFAHADEDPELASLPGAVEFSQEKATLGRLLFFDPRLSGDATISCAKCHQPELAWTDGLPLSAGYPGSRYFRNTPTILNIARSRHVYWDARLPASDLETVVRDHLSEAHFMQVDGRLIIERLRQVPDYEDTFRRLYGNEPTYGSILNALAEFVRSQSSVDVPFDKYLNGDSDALSEAAIRGLELFRGKAGCIRCHSGPLLTDGQSRSVGIDPNPEIFRDPERHITFRRFFRTLGVPDYRSLTVDVGCFCVSKRDEDIERMRTPSLRELNHTAPYMHDGQLATLEDVVEFYDAGAGPRASRDPLLKPLGLTQEEKQDLVAFLQSTSGRLPDSTVPEIPAYTLRQLGKN